MCRGEKKKTTLFTEKERQWPVAFLEGTEVFCWKNRKPGFPGPVRPLAGHLPQLPPILIAPASHQRLSCPFPFGPPLCPMLKSPGLRQSCLPKLTAWRQDSRSEGPYHAEHLLLTFLTAGNLTGTASLSMPSSVGHLSVQEVH